MIELIEPPAVRKALEGKASSATQPMNRGTMMAMFFTMSGQNSKKWAVARADRDFDEIKLWGLIENLKEPDQWPGLHLVLGRGELADLVPNDIIGRVCSPRLMDALKRFNLEILWLPVHLQVEKKEFVYYFMHFTFIPDVLDNEQTVYAGGRVLTPHLSLSKVSNLTLFCLRPLGKSTFLRGDVKESIESGSFIGLEFEKVAAS